MAIKNVTKSLLTQEDIEYGEGTVSQTRGGTSYNLNKVRTIVPVNSLVELNALDTTKFSKAALFIDGDVTFHSYILGYWVQDATLQVALADRVKTVSTFTDLATTPAVADQVVQTAGHTNPNIGSCVFIGVSGSIVGDGRLEIASATAGVHWEAFDLKQIEPELFGVFADGSTETAKIQSAINAAIFYKLPLEFNGGKTYRADVLNIAGNIVVNLNKCATIGVGSGFFKQTANCDYIHIFNAGSHTWSSQTGTIGKQFFWNTSEAAGSTAYGGELYYCKDFRFAGNKIGASKVSVGGSLTVPIIKDNEWTTADTVSVAPAYLFLSKGDTDADAGSVYVEENIFDVYPPSGSDKAIIKLTGGISGGQVHKNKLKNRNLASDAHFNVFTGAHKLKCSFNEFINVQLHRKQVVGSIPSAPTLYAYDLYLGNYFQSDDGWIQANSIYHIGNLAKYIANDFVIKNASIASIALRMDVSDVDTGFDTNAIVANIEALNTFNLTGAHASSKIMQVSPPTIGTSGARWNVMADNVAIGGNQLLSGGSQQYSATVGNVWGNSSGATGTAVNGGLTNVLTGNVADSSNVVFTGNSEGNILTESIPTLAAGATPDVTNGNHFYVNSGTNITGFVGGSVGKEITLFVAGTTTIVNSSTLRLSTGANFVMDTFTKSLTLIRVSLTEWREKSRSS